MKITASDRKSLIRLAYSLPQGDESRRAILSGLRKVSEDWIEKAVEKPGRLHKYFGIPEDENIPVSKINAEIKKLKSKEDRTDEETSLLRALNLAKTLKKMGGLRKVSGGMKKAALDAFQARAVFMHFQYPEEYWHPKELPDDNDVDTDEAESILQSEGLETFQRGMGYDEVDEYGDPIDEDDIDVGEIYYDMVNSTPLENIYDDIEREKRRDDKDLPKPPQGMKWKRETDPESYVLYNKNKEMGFIVTEDRSRGWNVHVLDPRSKKVERISRNVKRLGDAAQQVLDHLGLL